MSQDPVELYLRCREKLATDRAKGDLDAWQQWRTAPLMLKRVALQTAINRFDPMVQSKLREWGTAPQVSKGALHLELKDAVQKAHETWDPERSQLNTWVDWNMRKVLRHVHKHSDLAYSPAERSQLMGSFQRAADILKEDLGRDPTDGEIAEHLGKPAKLVGKIRTDLSRADIASSAFPEDPVSLFAQKHSPIALDVLGLLDMQPKKPEEDSFSPRTRQIYNYMRGVGGAPQVFAKGQIAKRLGTSPSTVTRGIKEIQAVIKKHT